VSIKLYMDVHVRQAITMGLRLRGVDVLTAQEDGARRLSDPLLLDRATALGRVLFSQDEDLLVEAAQRQQQGMSFAGVIYAHQLKVTIGQCVRDLELVAHAGVPEDFANRVQYLPLR
jgi:predicted nuclease of predicted toxin-antitoxin system